MQPSSLVFLVIIAVWAAYFVQYWVRRREHLATARSVDQFSESMRVLERRSPLSAADPATPQPRSYAASPVRVARPGVVQRAVAAPTSPTATNARTGAAPRRDDATAPRAHGAATHPHATGRRTRALVMLGALAIVVVGSAHVALSVVPLYGLGVPVLAAGGAMAWSRARAKAARRARLAARHTARRAGQPRPAAAPGARPVRATGAARAQSAAPVSPTTAATTTTATTTTATTTTATTTTAGTAAATAAAAAPAATAADGVFSDPTAEPDVAQEEPTPAPVRGELYDVQAVEASLRQRITPTGARPVATRALPAGPLVDEDDIPLTWDPVPVPRPTYAMKARVTRPAPTSADLVGDADTEYAAYEETAQRRVAGA